MSVLSDFVASHLGKCADVDGVFGCQCEDLVQAWHDATGTQRFHGNAIDVAGQANPDTDWIPAGSGLPQPGDVMVWGPTPALGIGALGHVDIVVDLVGPDSFRGLDQNWINSNPDHGSPAALVMHIYEGVLGWHHFHALDQEEEPMQYATKQAFVRLAYLAACGREPESQDALNAWANGIHDNGDNVDSIVEQIGDSAEGRAWREKLKGLSTGTPPAIDIAALAALVAAHLKVQAQ